MPRREQATIVGELLEALEEARRDGETRLTKIAARSNLAYDRFVERLGLLRERGLLSPQDPPRLTEQGNRLLGSYRQWREGLRLFGLLPPAPGPTTDEQVHDP